MNNLSLLFTTLILTSIARICECLFPSGNYATVFTPMKDNGDLHLDVIHEYARYIADNNMPGVYVLGSGGEGPSLNLNERQDVARAWMEVAREFNLIVIVQVGGMSLRDVLEMARFCENIGVFAIACLPELYYKAKTAEQAVNYLRLVSNAAPSLPIMYYDADSYTSPIFDASELFKLASLTIPQFVGMKTIINNALNTRSIYTPKSHQEIFVSSYSSIRATFELGFNKTISEPNNLFPDLVNKIQRAVALNDNEAAEAAQERINDLLYELHAGPYLHSKASMEIISGITLGPYRPPLYGPTYEQKRLMTRMLQGKGIRLASPVY